MSTYRLRRGLAWSDVSGEIVILDLESSLYFATKGTGACLVQELADGASDDNLVKVLTETYEVDDATARRDVEDFLGSLTDRGLLEPVDD